MFPFCLVSLQIQILDKLLYLTPEQSDILNDTETLGISTVPRRYLYQYKLRVESACIGVRLPGFVSEFCHLTICETLDKKFNYSKP